MSELYDSSGIDNWAKGTNLGDIKKTIAALGIQHRKNSPNKKPLASTVAVKLRKKQGITDKISYTMPRSAVFLHKGVGRGTPISKVGSTKRIAKRWFDEPTNRNLPELQRIVAEQDVTFVINNLNIK